MRFSRQSTSFEAVPGTCKVDDDSGLPFVNFALEAQQFFDDWYSQLQTRVRSGELTDVMAAHLAKYGSLMPSLALIFHFVSQCHGVIIGDVSLDAAEMAAAWCELLEAHALPRVPIVRRR